MSGYDLPCLGRPFQVGMLYDYYNDRLQPGMSPWDATTLTKACESQTHMHFSKSVEVSSRLTDNIESRCTQLGIDNGLKLSVISGLVIAKGSAEYLYHSQLRMNQARVCLKCEFTSKYEQVDLKVDELNSGVKHHEIATHVVTRVLYGADVYFVFECKCLETDKYKEVEQQLEIMAKQLSENDNIDGDFNSSLQGEKLQCKCYGDIVLPEHPKTFQDAVNLYKKLPQLLNDKRAVPKRAWLSPLSQGNSTCMLKSFISTAVVTQVQQLSDDLQAAIEKHVDLIGHDVLCHFPNIKEHLSEFGKCITTYKRSKMKQLQTALPLVRKGDEPETQLSDIVQEHEHSPFDCKNLKLWTKQKHSEIKHLSTILEQLQGIPILPSTEQDKIDSLIYCDEHQSVVCFAFNINRENDAFLDHLKNSGSKNFLFDVLPKPWHENNTMSRLLRTKFYQFQRFAKKNCCESRVKFFVTDSIASESLGDMRDKPVILLYNNGIPTEFEPPGKPSDIMVQKVTHGSVKLQWKKPQQGIECITHYNVMYKSCTNSSETWSKVKTIDEANSLTINGLLPFTSYLFKVEAVCEVGIGQECEMSEPVTTEQDQQLFKPGRPMAVEISSDSVQLRWTKSELSQDVKSYSVSYRSSRDLPDKWIEIKTYTRNEETGTVYDLVPQSTYFFKVCAETQDGHIYESEHSQPIKTKPLLPGKPGKPIILKATSSSVQIQWSKPKLNPALVKFYTIFYQTSSEPQDVWHEMKTGSNVETFTLNSLRTDQVYVFKVRSECESGSGPESDSSNQVITRAVPGKPGKPMAIKITSESITIEWTKPVCNEELIKGYKVFYRLSHESSESSHQWKQEKTDGYQSSLTIHGLIPATIYYFKVCAETENGCGEESNESECIPTHQLQRYKPGKPEAIKATDNSITLRWITCEVEAKTKYYTILYQSSSYSSNEDVWMIGGNTNTANEETFTVYNLSPQTEYLFKVTAECEDGSRLEGDFSDVLKTTKMFPGKPGKPVTTSVTEDSIELMWSRPSHASHLIKSYKVLYRLVNDPLNQWKWERTTGIDTKLIIHDLDPQSKYFFKVCSEGEDGYGIESECSDLISTKPRLPGKPGEPTAQTVSSNTIQLQWRQPKCNSQLIKFYTISYRSTKDLINVWKSQCTNGVVETLSVTSLISKEEYVFKVHADCEFGSGPESDISIPITTKSPTPGKPGKPTLISATFERINIKWTEPEHNSEITTGYKVLYRSQQDESNQWKEKATDGNQQKLSVYGLTPKSDYIFKVYAKSEDGFGLESDESDPLRTEPLLPGKPGKPKATDITSESIRIEWTQPKSNLETIQKYSILYRSSFDAPGQWRTENTTGNESYKTLHGLTANCTYFVKVHADSEDGPGIESDFSEPINTKCLLPGKPGKPIAINVTSNTINLEWQMPESNAKLTKCFTVLYRSANNPSSQWKRETTVDSSNSINLSSLIANHEYIFKVCPISEIGTGPESNPSDPIRTRPLIPGKSGKPTATSVTSDTIHLKWSIPNSNAAVTSSYTISYRKSNDPPDRWEKVVSKVNNITIQSLVPNSTYFFVVCPASEGGPGIKSDMSDPIQTKPLLPGKPGTPELKEVTDSTVHLVWAKPIIHSNIVTSYTLLYREHDGKLWKEQQSLSDQELSMTVKELQANTKYFFKIRPESKVGYGPESDEIYVSTKPLVPGKPNGKLNLTKIGHDHLWVSWNKPVRHPEVVKRYIVSYSTGKRNDRWLDMTTTETDVKILQLAPETKYFIKVRADGQFGPGPYSDICETSTKITLAECMRKISKLVSPRGQPQEIYMLPMKRVIISDKSKIAKCYVNQTVKTKTKCGEKVIMIVGGTGAGKTTLINGFVNYVFGIQWGDNFRFKLIADGEDGEEHLDQSHSQTKWITAYNMQAMEGSRTPYSLTIIDTPGFGDTAGIERDKELVSQIQNFFETKNGIDQLHGIGFVVQASLARLTHTQKYVFDSILSLFGKDIKNIFMMVTFADAKDPPVLKSLAAHDIKYDSFFKFNNSALFAAPGLVKSTNFDQLFWELGMDSFKNFFDKLDEVKPQSLTLTKEVLEERQRLETIVNGLQPQITAGLNKIEEIRNEENILKDKETEISRNQDFHYKVTITKQRKVDLETGKYVTNCLICNYTCHYPCIYANDGDKYRCSAMDNGGEKNAKCRVCPLNCNWGDHYNNPYKFELYQETETRTLEDLKQRYDVAQGEKIDVEVIITKMHKELEVMEEVVLLKVNEARECLRRLDEIALKPDPLNEVDYIDLLIESEKRQSRPGFLDRMKALEELKLKAQLVKGLKESTATAHDKDGWWKKLFTKNVCK